MAKPPIDECGGIICLFPELTAEQRQEINDAFMEYVKLCVRIHEGIRREPERHARFKALVEERRRARLSEKGQS